MLVVWFGIGTVPAIVTAFVICFFPITVNVAAGLATIEPEMEDVLRSLGAMNGRLKEDRLAAFATLFFRVVESRDHSCVRRVSGVGDDRRRSRHRLPDDVGWFAIAHAVGVCRLIVISAMAMIMYEVFAVIEHRMTGWATRGMDQVGT